jgi:cell division protein FtsN
VAIGPTITAGIRGTDIWGRSDREQELLCLIEGMIEIGGPGQARQVMDQPLTFYVVPRDQPALPVASAPAGQLERWTAQTELNPDRPAMSAEGGYMVGLESHLAADAAHAAVTRLDERGYAAEVVRAAIAGQTWYRVVLSGFGSAAEAARFAAEARSSLGLQSPWVIAPDNL